MEEEIDERLGSHEEEMMIFPLTLDDLREKQPDDYATVSAPLAKKKNLLNNDCSTVQRFSLPLVQKWRTASRRLLDSLSHDSWSDYRIADLYPEEECVRHRYSAMRQKWITDRAWVKMETTPFGRGAMRECFRLKKLAGGQQPAQDAQQNAERWCRALNYVAKRYLNEDKITRNSYFADVQLQADAKLWSEEFNRHNPPKKIDIIQVSILEFPNRPGQPLYHLEHYIEGEYTKYNSNSGFVSEQARQTPQAFSHFTFECSGHQLIVVDVQGVGDLYTDPQIHTADGKSNYGDGDLGTKGMALFFHSHVCNSICESMNLTPFDLSPTERALQKQGSIKMFDSKTFCRQGSIEMCHSPSVGSAGRVTDFLRHRTSSKSECGEGDLSAPLQVWITDDNENPPMSLTTFENASNCDERMSNASISPPPTAAAGKVSSRFSFSSESNSVSGETGYTSGYSTSHDIDAEQWQQNMRKISRPSCVPGDLNQLKSWKQNRAPSPPRDESMLILGTIHMDFVQYYEAGRFSDLSSPDMSSTEYDKSAAWFHLDMAARCGILEAVLTMARIYLTLPHDILKDFKLDEGKLSGMQNFYHGNHQNGPGDFDDDAHADDEETDVDRGLDLMEEAANMGDRSAMLFLAEAYETGRNLGTQRQISWLTAVEWYEKAVSISNDENMDENANSLNIFSEYPRYQVLAKMAELYRKGGPLLSPNSLKAGHLYSEAAEMATEATKGKLASKFYMLSEEAFAEAEEE